jgi:AAA ATPase domain
VTNAAKGDCPFYPTHPVPVELFTGRSAEIERIVQRGIRQVADGRQHQIFVQGDFGIGKSSIARFTQNLAEEQHGLLRLYASLAGAETLDDLATAVMEAALRSKATEPSRLDRVRDLLARYLGKQNLFGVGINFEALKREPPNLKSPAQILSFLEALRGYGHQADKGVFLVLDEINGIAAVPQFARLLKGLVDTNALHSRPVPLLLMLCGVPDRRRQLIDHHSPVERIFDVIDIHPLAEDEVRHFFYRAFQSVGLTVAPPALELLTRFSAGYPRIMHLIGEAAFFTAQGPEVTAEDATAAVVEAAEDLGKKFVDPQVYAALRSDDYRSILDKLGQLGHQTFTPREVEAGLTVGEKKKLTKFLQKMKKLNVIRSGAVRGQYEFCMSLVQMYLRLQSSRGRPRPSKDR